MEVPVIDINTLVVPKPPSDATAPPMDASETKSGTLEVPQVAQSEENIDSLRGDEGILEGVAIGFGGPRDENGSDSGNHDYSSESDEGEEGIVIHAGRSTQRRHSYRPSGSKFYQRPQSLAGTAKGGDANTSAVGRATIASDEELKKLRFARHVTAFDVDVNALEDKPWRNKTVDLLDYFNYGFNERTWLQYCEKQLRRRAELGMGPVSSNPPAPVAVAVAHPIASGNETASNEQTAQQASSLPSSTPQIQAQPDSAMPPPPPRPPIMSQQSENQLPMQPSGQTEAAMMAPGPPLPPHPPSAANTPQQLPFAPAMQQFTPSFVSGAPWQQQQQMMMMQQQQQRYHQQQGRSAAQQYPHTAAGDSSTYRGRPDDRGSRYMEGRHGRSSERPADDRRNRSAVEGDADKYSADRGRYQDRERLPQSARDVPIDRDRDQSRGRDRDRGSGMSHDWDRERSRVAEREINRPVERLVDRDRSRRVGRSPESNALESRSKRSREDSFDRAGKRRKERSPLETDRRGGRDDGRSRR